MGAISKNRNLVRRGACIALACLPFAAASPTAAVVPDKGPVVSDQPTQSPSYRMAPNEPRGTFTSSPAPSSAAPAIQAPSADGSDTLPIVLSSLLALAAVTGTALVLVRRRHRGLRPAGS